MVSCLSFICSALSLLDGSGFTVPGCICLLLSHCHDALLLSHHFDIVVALPLPCHVTIVMPCYHCHAVLPFSSCLAYVIDATLTLLCGSAFVIPHFIRHAARPVTPCYIVALPLSCGFTAVAPRCICYAALLPSWHLRVSLALSHRVESVMLGFRSCNAVPYHVACQCHITLSWLYGVCICNAYCICHAVLPLA